MQVPNTNNFTLQDVINVVNPPSNTLASCFAAADPTKFDPAFVGAKDRLSNFRNYGAVATTTLSLGVAGTANSLNELWTIGNASTENQTITVRVELDLLQVGDLGTVSLDIFTGDGTGGYNQSFNLTSNGQLQEITLTSADYDAGEGAFLVEVVLNSTVPHPNDGIATSIQVIGASVDAIPVSSYNQQILGANPYPQA